MLVSLLMMVMTYQPNQIDAMVSWRSGKMYAFSGTYYYRYSVDTNRMDPGYPKTIQGNWPGLPFTTIDAAINWQNGKAYFFSGAYYVRYDIATDRIDPGYPQSIAAKWGLNWDRVDAALYWGNGKAYLFNNTTGTYVRWSVPQNTIDPGYPKYTSGNWKGFPFPKVGGATSYNGKGYFTWGNQFTRWNIARNTPEQGFPQTLNYLPASVGGGYSPPVANNSGYGTNPPPPVNRPPVTTPPPAQATGNSINGTLTYVTNAYQQWNNVRVDLYQANSYFTPRYNQLIGMGYAANQAMTQCVAEPNLWTFATSSTTKPCQFANSTYGWNYSWFGFVNLKPSAYKIEVQGYPNLRRWVNFPGANQKITVALEHR